jgi:flagellum-specific peptidoglycan hydrolase FlgJ
MRKKFIKSSRPTYKKRIKKAQQGMRFVSYNPVSNPTIDYTDITNPINPFSEYNFNTVYDKPEALVVPVRDTNEPDVVANNPIAEPVINKPVASKSVTDKPVTKTANSTWKSPYTNRKQWSTELINAYKKAGITNDNAIRMLLAQDALESSWGKSAQGKYNFGNLTTGSSWKGDYVTGNDKNAKGEAIKQKFRSYNSMDEYAADKIQFLKRLYDFDENDDINKFVAKLTGSNKGKRRYAEATNYAKVLTGVYNGIPKGENGMIIKYQNPPHGIARRDAIQDYRPDIPNRIRKATPAEHIQSMINIYGQSEQPTVTSDAKSPWQHQQAHEAASKGYDDYMQAKKYEEGLHNLNGILTFTDYATLATGLGSLLSKGASMAGKQVGKQMAKRAIRRESRKHIPSNSDPFLNLGRSFNDFGNPRRSITESLNNFIEYLNDPETIKRLQDIDKELGTRYMEGRQWFLDEAAKGNIKFNPIEMWDGNNRIINGMKYPNYSQTLIGDPFLSNPSYKNITTNIVKQDHPSTIGHEVKHGIENYLEVLNKPNMTMEGFKSQHGSGKRLQALFDKDNIKSFEEWRASIKADPQFRTASDEAITNMYNYLTQESEFSSNLHPLVEANIIKGRPGVPNYRDLADFEDVLNNSYYAPPWAAGRDPMTNVKLIYNHLIKDKHRFLSKLNKYGWGIAALGVGMNLMNY